MQPFVDERVSPLESVFQLIGDDLEKVEREFRSNLKSSVPLISTIGEHLLLSGGKRFRPSLLLLSARLCGYRGEQHIPMASLVEFIHTATLLHDDVVDQAELRRGKVSANSLWGNEASVLVGDFLFTKSFSMLVKCGDWKIFRTISESTTMMAEGEMAELVKTNDLSLTEEDYLSIISYKTASLISATAQIGAILGNVSEEKENALSQFGRDVGIAFQLTDDNLDYVSREEEFGKEIGIDLQDGKVTLPLIRTLQCCAPEETSLIRKTLNSPVTKEDFLRVVEMIERYQGIHYTREKAKQCVERAKDHLRLFPDGREKEALCMLADYVMDRRL